MFIIDSMAQDVIEQSASGEHFRWAYAHDPHAPLPSTEEVPAFALTVTSHRISTLDGNVHHGEGSFAFCSVGVSRSMSLTSATSISLVVSPMPMRRFCTSGC